MNCPDVLSDEERFLKGIAHIISVIWSSTWPLSARKKNSAAFAMATHALHRAKKKPEFARLLFGRHRGTISQARRATRILVGKTTRTHVRAAARILREGLTPKTVYAMIRNHGLVNFANRQSPEQAAAQDHVRMKSMMTTLADRSRSVPGAAIADDFIDRNAEFGLALVHRQLDGSFSLRLITDDLSKVSKAVRVAAAKLASASR